MKRIITILLALVMAVLLCGCGDTAHSDRMMLIATNDAGAIYVDQETGVEYIKSGTEIEMLVDSYGNPYIYPAFDAREDRLP